MSLTLLSKLGFKTSWFLGSRFSLTTAQIFKLDREFKPAFQNTVGASGIIGQLHICVKVNYVTGVSGHLHIVE